jgi:hypothetical protein
VQQSMAGPKANVQQFVPSGQHLEFVLSPE